jgi:hypothetical protein
MLAAVRTLIVTGALCAVVLVIFWQLRINDQEKAIAELRELNAEMETRLAERQAMVDRLGRTTRLAHIEVSDQRTRDDGGLETDILFIELDAEGSELDRQTFTIPGPVLFVDVWTVKFDHESVAVGHPLRGRSLVLLRRVYSDQIRPADGFPIDTPGAVPPAYAAGEIGRFEQKVWEHFWDIAGDAGLAESMHVRVAQGEAVYKSVRPGQRFELIVDNAGGISLTPMPEAVASGT